MAEGASIGSVHVDVVPRAADFWSKFQAQAGAGASRVGDQLGATVGKGIQDRIAKGMVDGIQSGGRSATTTAARGGTDAGEAFGKAAKARIEAALKSLPDVKIDGDSSKLDKKIAAIRAELKTLGKADIADEASQARLAALRTQLGSLVREVQKLKEEGKDVPLGLDVFKAQGEVAALGKEIAAVKRDAAKPVKVPVEVDQPSLSAFERLMRQRLGAAAKSLPDVKVGADTSEADRRIAEIRARLAELSGKSIGVDIDAGAALAEINALQGELRDLGAQSPNVQVRADVAAAAGELAGLEFEVAKLDGRVVNVRADADTGGAIAGLFGLNSAAGAATGGIQGLIAAGIAIAPAIVPAAAAAAAAIGAIGPAAVVGGAGIGVLALGIVPVIGAVKAMDAAQNAAGKSAASSAGKQGQLAGAIDGVRSAQASLANTTANAAEANRRAEQRVTDAVRSETTAQQALLRAQQAINDAREAARRSLEDLANRQADLALDQRKSALDITKAEQDLAKARATAAKAPTAGNQRAVAEAQLALDEQIQRSKELSTEQKRLAADKARADKAGVDGSKQVVAAQDAITQAQEKVRASQQGVADARHQQDETARQGAFSVTQAQQGVVNAQRAVQSASVSAGTAGSAAMTKLQQAMAGLSPAGQAFATFLFGLKGKFTDLSKTAQEGLLPGLQSFIEALLPLMPQVNTLIGILATTMGDLFRQAGPVVAEILPPFLTMLGQVGPPIMEAFAKILLNVGKGFGGIIEAFAPFAVKFFQGLGDLSTKFADFGTTLSTNPGFQAFIDYVTTNGPTLLSLLGALATLAIKLLIGFAPLGEILLNGATAVAQFLAALPPGVLLLIAYAIGLIVVSIAAIVGGPITAAVAVITIFAAAWVYAYTKVQWFHDLVNAYVTAIVAVVTWLWQTAVIAFNGIAGVVSTVWSGFLLPAFTAIWGFIQNVLAPIFVWLWQNIIQPVWQGIQLAISIAWAIIQVIFGLIQIYITAVLAPLFLWLWGHVIVPAWDGIKLAIEIAWAIIQVIFGLIVIFVKAVLAPIFTWLWHNVIEPVWGGIAAAISWTWDNVLKPVFSALGGFIRDFVVPAFKTAVDAIGRAWDGLRDLAKKPIEFVVKQIINPLINGYNDLAKTFGAPHVNPIPGFAYGGFVSGPGGPRDDQIFAMLSNGEYVIPAHVVRSLGVGFFDQLIGQPTTRYPGDGSQGLAFADGGFVGFFKDVWNGLTDPIGLLKKPAEALLSKIPGGEGVKGLLAGMGHKLIDGLLNFLGGGGTPGSDVNKTRAFVQSQVGKPYVWASAGPGGYDCSGIVSAAWNLLHGRSPYSHTFSTSNEAGFFPKPGPGGPLTAGWTNPGEPGPGGNNVGHTAGVIAGLPFESTGGVGVRTGRGVTPVGSFAHVGHFRDGGQVRFGVYDSGGQLPPGLTLAYNGTGSPETIRTADQEAALRRGGATITQHIYPQPGQSEPEIAAAASRQLAWELR